jgi:HK97 family phage prohead protease
LSDEPEDENRAEWSASYVNSLPDSAFACIDAGGTKDSEGRTTPRSLRHYPHHDASGKVDPPHLANARARVNQAGTASCGYSHLFETHSLPSDQAASAVVAKDDLFRSMPGHIDLRQTEDGRPLLNGHFSVFDQWTRINSVFEGTFMERIAPGAFTDTIAEDRAQMQVLYDHGFDPTFGNKPLGPITDLREDETGAYYEVPLIPTSYNRDMEEMLRAGLLGSSFRFSVTSEDFDPRPKRSDYNPDAIPERTVRAARVREFGPVTFPAYAGATAGVRSDTDAYLQRLRVPTRELLPTPERPVVATRHSGEESRVKRFASREEYLTWLLSI